MSNSKGKVILNSDGSTQLEFGSRKYSKRDVYASLRTNLNQLLKSFEMAQLQQFDFDFQKISNCLNYVDKQLNYEKDMLQYDRLDKQIEKLQQEQLLLKQKYKTTQSLTTNDCTAKK